MGFFHGRSVRLYGICQKQAVKCQKFSFWQNEKIFGKVFGICLMIEMDEMPRNKGIQGLYGKCQKQDLKVPKIWLFGRMRSVFGIYGEVFGKFFKL